jgi:hypothetical protein
LGKAVADILPTTVVEVSHDYALGPIAVITAGAGQHPALRFARRQTARKKQPNPKADKALGFFIA